MIITFIQFNFSLTNFSSDSDAGVFVNMSVLFVFFTFVDILHVASLRVNGSSSRVTIKCFSEFFSGIDDLPSTNKPVDCSGLLIDLSGQSRWRPFATWILKLIGKCLTEGTLYVEGLIHVSFVSAACSLLCYGDSDLHMVGDGWWEFGIQVFHLILLMLLSEWYRLSDTFCLSGRHALTLYTSLQRWQTTTSFLIRI